MSNENTAVATAKAAPLHKSVKSWISSETFKAQVALALPKHFNVDRYVRVCLTALTRVPKLAQCTPESVLKCMMTCSELGLEPDGRRAHLIPYKQECTLIVDYKGLVELAMNSGTVSSIFAEKVCDKDVFTWDTGEIKHEINWRQDRGEPYAYYCIVRFRDGGKHTEVMTKADVDRIRARSMARNSGPWVTDFDEMAKKTVFRRASKWVKLSPEVQDALEKEADPAPTTSALVIDNPLPEPQAEPERAAIPVESISRTDALPTRETAPAQSEPERQVEKKAPEPVPTAQPETPQQRLASVVTGGGFTFDHLQRWCVTTGNYPEADSIASFDEVPVMIAQRLCRATAGLLKGLAEVKGGVA